jgi:hypothetical protein
MYARLVIVIVFLCLNGWAGSQILNQINLSAWPDSSSRFGWSHCQLHSAPVDTACAKNFSKLSFQILGSLQGGVAQLDTAVGYGFGGACLDWKKGKYFSLNLGYVFAGGKWPSYFKALTQQGFLPGMGYVVNNQKGIAHSHVPFGSMRWIGEKFFSAECGIGKQFWGDGYRSMILSDNAAARPFIRFDTEFSKVKYTNLWLRLDDISQMQRWTERRHKYAAMHSLSFQVNKRLNIAFYEMVIWQDRDSMSRRNFDLNYINPVIFYRPVEYSVGSPDNVLLAFSFRYNLGEHAMVYGQFLLDEFNFAIFRTRQKWWGNKLGGQFGVSLHDILPNVSLRSELNIARPFTYAHGSPVQAWTHFNQPMAHPLGANFAEWINQIFWKRKSWGLGAAGNIAFFGRDFDADGDGLIDNFGGNITRSYEDPYGGPFGHKMFQGMSKALLFFQLDIAYSPGTSNRYEIFINPLARLEVSSASPLVPKVDSETIITLGIRTTGLLMPKWVY